MVFEGLGSSSSVGALAVGVMLLGDCSVVALAVGVMLLGDSISWVSMSLESVVEVMSLGESIS